MQSPYVNQLVLPGPDARFATSMPPFASCVKSDMKLGAWVACSVLMPSSACFMAPSCPLTLVPYSPSRPFAPSWFSALAPIMSCPAIPSEAPAATFALSLAISSRDFVSVVALPVRAASAFITPSAPPNAPPDPASALVSNSFCWLGSRECVALISCWKKGFREAPSVAAAPPKCPAACWSCASLALACPLYCPPPKIELIPNALVFSFMKRCVLGRGLGGGVLYPNRDRLVVRLVMLCHYLRRLAAKSCSRPSS